MSVDAVLPIPARDHCMADHGGAVPPELAQLLNGAPPADRDRAWTTLVATHSRLLMAVARTLATEHDGVMDAYAYVLERLREDNYRRLRQYVADNRANFTTWLVVVARGLCVDHHRHQYGRTPRGNGSTSNRADRGFRRRLLELAPAMVDLTSIVDERNLAADESVQVAQRNQALGAVLDTLDPADRVLLKLRFEDDLPAREIATILQMPSVFHVYRRLASVCALLRRQLVARGVESSTP
jgi:RNA polymerase sigma factor (sigma-70 family)